MTQDQEQCPEGWSPFGTHVDIEGPLEFAGLDEAGMPQWERLHQLKGPSCSCGWSAPLGTSIWREWDKHIRDLPRPSTGAFRIRTRGSTSIEVEEVYELGFRDPVDTVMVTGRSDCPGPTCVIYTCPSTNELECTVHGGFEACCDHQECPANILRAAGYP